MESNGYAGKVLKVDLSTGKIEIEPIYTQLAKNFIGGWGLNAKLAYDLIKPGMEALSPEMPIILGAGLLTGTLSPSTPKSFLTAKCPASGTVTTAVGSGYFGSMLKWAGYDHVIITGRAEKPVYLKIADDGVEICDARQIWGKDISQATD